MHNPFSEVISEKFLSVTINLGILGLSEKRNSVLDGLFSLFELNVYNFL